MKKIVLEIMVVSAVLALGIYFIVDARHVRKFHKTQEAYIANIFSASVSSNVWSRSQYELPTQMLDRELLLRSDSEEKCRELLIACAEEFLLTRIRVEDYITSNAVDDFFVLFVRDLLFRMRKYNCSDDIRIDFFCKSLKKYRDYCFSEMPREIIDGKKEKSWRGALASLRGLLGDNLRIVKSELFEFYLSDLSDENKSMVSAWFEEFYRKTMEDCGVIFKKERDEHD